MSIPYGPEYNFATLWDECILLDKTVRARSLQKGQLGLNGAQHQAGTMRNMVPIITLIGEVEHIWLTVFGRQVEMSEEQPSGLQSD